MRTTSGVANDVHTVFGLAGVGWPAPEELTTRVRRVEGWTGNLAAPGPHAENNPDLTVKVHHNFASAGDIECLKAITK